MSKDASISRILRPAKEDVARQLCRRETNYDVAISGQFLKLVERYNLKIGD